MYTWVGACALGHLTTCAHCHGEKESSTWSFLWCAMTVCAMLSAMTVWKEFPVEEKQ